MADLFFADLVREASRATGAGAFALAGAVPGHRRFQDAVPQGAHFHYAIAGVTRPEEWETGEGYVDGTGVLRRAPSASSAGGGAVDFSPGLKTVALTAGAAWYQGQQAELAGKAPLHHDHALDELAGAQAALDGKAAVSHGHSLSDVTGLQTALDAKATAAHAHAVADIAGLQGALDGKAAVSHGHALGDVTGLQSALDAKQAAGSYAAAVHGHAVGDVAGLQAALDAKQAAGSYAAAVHGHAVGDVAGLQAALDGKQAAGSYAAAVHNHGIAEVTGLQAALDGKQAAGSYAAAVHGHAIGDVTGLQSALDGKAALGGATFTGPVSATALSLGTALPLSQGGTGAATAAAARTSLGLVIGTNVAAYDAGLASLAALDGTPGLVEQTGVDSFASRAIGTGAAASVLTRGDGDGRYLLASGYTAADILAKLVNVDGTGSGLDADYLDGNDSSAFAKLSGAAFTGSVAVAGTLSGTTFSRLSNLRVEGTGSGFSGTGVGLEMFQAGGTGYLSVYNRTTNAYAPFAMVGSSIALQINAATVASVASTGFSVTGQCSVSSDYRINGTKVVGARAAGWSAATGTATRTAFDTSSVTTAQLAERVKALIDDLVAHGLIGA